MTFLRRIRSLVLIAGVCASGLACGGQGSGAAADESAPIGVTNSRFGVTVENRAGQPLTEVRVEVIPAGRTVVYTSFYGRLEAGQKQEFSVTSFRGRDGTPLDLRIARPRTIRVTAQDLTGKPYEVERRWQQ